MKTSLGPFTLTDLSSTTAWCLILVYINTLIVCYHVTKVTYFARRSLFKMSEPLGTVLKHDYMTFFLSYLLQKRIFNCGPT